MDLAVDLMEQAQHELGTLILTGVPGQSLTPESAQFLQDERIGGVIYFASNYANPKQLAEFSQSIQDLDPILQRFIGVDQEGGRVQRFQNQGFTKVPAARKIGDLRSPKLAYEIAQHMGEELRTVGINLSFAPVCDILTEPKNPVIGDRAFAEDAETVSVMASATVRGLSQAGVLACAKHFPGHGDTTLDSHFALPSIATSLETLQSREWLPFQRAIRSKCPIVMTAHIVAMALDPTQPATLSRIVLQDYLRKQLRFDGVIVSDDLEMKAISDAFPGSEGPRRALEAGCDLLIFRTLARSREALADLRQDLKLGTLSPERVLESAARVHALRDTMPRLQDQMSPDDVMGALAASQLPALLKSASLG